MGWFESKKDKADRLAKKAIEDQHFIDELDYHCAGLYKRLPRITRVLDENTHGILYRIKECMEHLELEEVYFEDMIVYVDEENKLAIGTIGEEDEK